MNYPLQRPIVLESFEVHAVQRQFPIVILLGVSECGNFGDVNVSMLFTVPVICGLWCTDLPPQFRALSVSTPTLYFQILKIFDFFEEKKLIFIRWSEPAGGRGEEE